MRGGYVPNVTGLSISRFSTSAASSGVKGLRPTGGSSSPARSRSFSNASTSSRPSSTACRVRSSALPMSTVPGGMRAGASSPTVPPAPSEAASPCSGAGEALW